MAHIAVVGDLILDNFLVARTTGLARQFPVPQLKVVRRFSRPGGAGNVAVNLTRLGHRVSLSAVVGGDRNGAKLRRMLAAAGVSIGGVDVARGRQTSTRQWIVAEGSPVCRIDVDFADAEVTGAFSRWGRTPTLALPADALVVSDSRVRSLADRAINRVIAIARDSGVPIIVDPAGPNWLPRYAGATVLLPSESELANAYRGSIEAAARTCLRDLTSRALLVTRGKDDALLVTATDARVLAVRPRSASFGDIGAGDLVVAGLTDALLRGEPIGAAARTALRQASTRIGDLGTLRFSRSSAARIVNGPDLLRLAADWKARGESIVFTNGCFDILHAGHVHFLAEARRLGDRLIVAVNSDDSVRRLKGPERPFVPESSRATAVAQAAHADAVTVFTEPDPGNLIRNILPDVLVKGDEYAERPIPGEEEVRVSGGMVVVVPRIHDLMSTTNIADTVRRGSSTVPWHVK